MLACALVSLVLIASHAPVIVPPAVVGGGGGPGNIASFQFDDAAHPWGPEPVNGYLLTNGGGGSPGPDYSRISSDSYTGAGCLQANHAAPVGSDGGGNAYLDIGSSPSRIFIVAAKKWLTVPLSGIATKKMLIYRQGGFNTQYGEMNVVSDGFKWIWLQDAGATFKDITYPGSVSSRVGLWDIWKFEYDQRTTKPIFRVGFNGVDNVFSSQANDVTAQSAGIIDFGGPLNDGSGACKFNWDHIEIGNVDPGWP
jgi:hypothetical protein